MYAVIDIGGKQRRVREGEVVRVESIGGDPGDPVVFDRVFAVGEGESLRLGVPTVDGAVVRGTVVSQARAEKIHVFTFKKRKNSSRKRRGHRQNYTAVKIDAIEA